MSAKPPRGRAQARGLALSLAVTTVTASLVAVCLFPPEAWAQSDARPAAPSPNNATDPESIAARAAEIERERARREGDLKALQEALTAAAEARRRLDAEIADLSTDRARLNTALLETTARIRSTEERSQGLEQRLQILLGSEAAIRRSLESRRGVIIEVLAALQRMGRRPPPAVLVRPEDILEAVRTSMLLGSVVPELRAETEALAGDLTELVRLREAIAADRETLRREGVALAHERERLGALIAARQQRLAEAQRSVGDEQKRVDALAGQAKSLKELVDRMEGEVTSARRAAEEAKAAAEAQAKETRERFAAAAFRDPARLAPKIPFTEARGILPRPVSGETVRGFGAPDGSGGTTRGISISTRPGEIVVSPADGWVAFAGPFRSFGRLLIINAGGGYYLLLAGMDQINVDVGQFVLAGEPIAAMGSAQPTAAGAGGMGNPTLYVEFRKDGGSVDPGPWWQKMQSEKVRG